MRIRWSMILLSVSTAAAIFCLAACGSSRPPITIAITTAPPATLQVGTQTSVAATVMNDSSNAGVDWSLSCIGDCGSFTPHTASGGTMTFTAPLTVPSSNAVTVIATSTADKSKSVSAKITITPVPISVSFQSAPPAGMETNAAAMITADVSNDSSNTGVDWSVTCGSAGACGSFSPTHTASGSATTYTAPSAVPAGNTVTISATSSADRSKSVQANIAIGSPADLAKLSGSYVFEVSGEDANSSPYTIAGQLTADGAGNITGGEDDFSDFSFALPNTITSGTYFIGPDERGTITIDDNRGQETFSIALVSGTHILISEFDFGGTSTGTMDKQTVPSGGFNTSTLSGGFAFALFGIDVSSAFPLGWGGVMNIDTPGGISGTGSVADINDGGTVSTTQALTGSVQSVDALGRADILLTAGSFAGVEVIAYIADGTHLKLVEIDSVFGATGGTAIGQGPNTGTFTSNTALSENFAFSTMGISAPFVTAAAGGLFTADGTGNINSGVLDFNAGGVPTNANFTTTYSVDSSGAGRGTISLGPPGQGLNFAFYLAGGGSPLMLVELDSNGVTTGTAFPQASGPFSASTFSGTYAMNFTENFLVNEEDATGQVSVDGVGSLAGTVDADVAASCDFGCIFNPQPGQPLSGTFAANSNGRFTATLNTASTGTINVAFYIVDSTRVLFIETDTAGVTLGVFELQSVPLP